MLHIESNITLFGGSMNQKWKKNIKKYISSVSILLPYRSKMSETQAREILEMWCPCPTGTCIANNLVEQAYDLQIIVPAYNVENYIEPCLTSIVTQNTHYKCLLTIVNDGSTDSTPLKIDRFISSLTGGYNEETNIEIELITQNNRGLSGARNRVLQVIRGKYVMFVDSDDIVPPDTIEKMLNEAHDTDADILQGSWYDFIEEPTNIVKEHVLSKDGILSANSGVFSGFPWGKLYKYTVLEKFKFPEGFWFEDTPVSFILAAMTYKFAAIKDMVYGYRLNPNGISAISGSFKKSVDSFWITERCLEEFPEFGIKYDQRAYEYFLRQAYMNWNRTKKQPRKIREAIFILTIELKNRYFQGMKTEDVSLKKIENTLEKKQYLKYELTMISRV